ncbi:mechanosensitive ion channel family protein [Polyangium sp. 6x1]|uniref:mechanosensitive ion channel family protein n=1 Tax=Polyangium sp. 6x1 TaxID=3042689 RepID=UPI0024827BBA|nr:mechanosensitive ion channel family protein [Polyangium sp. 6x1]MDI1449365.1 mechanosensitive ion channel family protein [Polyangium sp. 6x1]
MNETIQKYIDLAVQIGMNVGLKILGAIVLWIVGRIVVRAVLGILDRSLRARKIDDTVTKYMGSVAGVLLNILLILSVLSVFGIETTTFAGLLAAAGVAIGVAWSGLLSNLASGVFMIVLRPFKVGDYVIAGGVEGTVHSIGLFVTAIDTPDNVRTFVGNGKIFGDTIKNFSENPYRRVELVAQLSGQADVHKAIAVLKEKLKTIPNVAKTPAPDVELLTFTLAGPVLAVRPYCHTNHYWGVYFATNEIINDEIGKLGFPAPANPVLLTGNKNAA